MPSPARQRPEPITTAAGLNALCDRLRQAGRFGFDTEFVGEDSYDRHICLIQVASESGCDLIDPMEGLDLSVFWALVTSPDVEKIAHSGSEDVAICRQETGGGPRRLFDTQIAAGLVGFGYPTSLLRLVRATVGARLHKSQTLTDWRRRPLSNAQIEYAVDDVLHLPELHERLSKRLRACGRLEWLEEECLKLCTNETNSPAQRLRRVRGAGSLGRKQLAIVEALQEAREELAREYDRPPRAVLRDHLLIELARRGWTDVERVRTLRGINLRRAGIERLVAAVEAALQLPEDQWPVLPKTDEDSPELDALADLASAVLRDYCNRSGVAMSLLANKQDVRTYVRARTRGGADGERGALASGWRGEAVGGMLDDVLAGRRAIRVESDGGERRLRID